MMLLKALFDNNEKWAAAALARDPEFFHRLVNQQAPQLLWIGCSDSRVPANEITGLLPGEVFVHRNVGNIVSHSDLNCLSAIQYSVGVLRVRHIIVVGHYGCGGVHAALHPGEYGLVYNWLRPIREVRQKHRALLDSLPDESTKWDRLCELNVVEQAREVTQVGSVRQAWAQGHELAIHGWIYGIHDGRLRDLNFTVTAERESQATYESTLKAMAART